MAKKEKEPKQQKPLTPKQQAKQEKREKALQKQRQRKIIILDNFNKKILNVVLAVLIISILAPLIVFSFVSPTKLVSVDNKKGVSFYAKYSDGKVNSLTYTYKQVDDTITKDYLFKNNTVYKRVETTKTATTTTVIVIRKLSMLDKDYIKANISGLSEATDAQIKDYLSTSTDYIKIVNTKTAEDFVVTSQTITTQTELEVDGVSYKDVYTKLGFSGTVVASQAEYSYHMLGIGYDYTNYVLTDDLDNVLTFEGTYVESLKVGSTTYDFTINKVSFEEYGLKNI